MIDLNDIMKRKDTKGVTMTVQPFIHLCVRSEFNMDSTIKIDALLTQCKKMNMNAVALTDEHTLHHVVDFAESCRKHEIKPIVGAQFTVKHESGEQEHIFLLAKNNKGYGNIIKLSSLTFSKTGKGHFVTVTELQRFMDNTFVLIDNQPGFVFDPKHTFVRLRYDKNTHPTAIELASSLGVGIVAADDVNHFSENDGKLQDMLRSAREKKTLQTPKGNNQYLKTPKEIENIYADYPRAVENTKWIADACNVTFTLKGDVGFKRLLPRFPIPDDVVVPDNLWTRFNHMPGFIPPTDEQEIRTIAHLIKLSEKEFVKKYGKNNRAAVKRIRNELGVIIGKEYVDYFLIIEDFISFAKKKNISLGPGRGSSAGSLLARILGIVELDPLEYKLHFERFLNVEREDDPDVDMDISKDRRHELFDYAKVKYGIKNVGQIITFNVYGATSSVNASGKVLSIAEDKISKITRLIPENSSIRNALEKGYLDPVLEEIKKDPLLSQMMHFAQRMEGYPQSKSRHGAGVIISSNTLASTIPVTVEKVNGQPMLVSQIPNNNKQLEKLGFSKIDFLSSRNVDILEDVKQLVRKTKGIDIQEIPIDDEKTLELFRQGTLSGVFQMDGKGMKEASKTISPNSLKDIIALLALYRPGPMKEIPVYANNKANHILEIRDVRNEIIEGVEDILPVLEDTHGVIVYQEQINQIAQIWAGYKLGEADVLRRAISGKKADELLKGEEQFMKYSLEQGRGKEASKKIYELILAFADYGFPRAHASIYGLLTYQQAWYKANYPVEYMSVVMNSLIDVGNKKKTIKTAEYIAEARRMGVDVSIPDVNTSSYQFEVEGDRIVFGLSMAKNIGIGAAKEIIAHRPYTSLSDLTERTNPAQVTILVKETLIKMGALDALGSRKLLLEELKSHRQNRKDEMYTFESVPSLAMSEWSSLEMRSYEVEVSGMMQKNPMLAYQSWIENYRAIRGDQWIFGLVVGKKLQKDKYKKEMAYLKVRTLLDEEYELTIFSSTWGKLEKPIAMYEPIMFKGTSKESMYRLIANEIEPLPQETNVTITIPKEVAKWTEQERNEWLEKLRVSVKSVPGVTPVQLQWGNDCKDLGPRYSVDVNKLTKVVEAKMITITKM